MLLRLVHDFRRAMDLSLVLPGHGRPITDHVTLIDERFRLHRRRAEKIHRLIAATVATIGRRLGFAPTWNSMPRTP